MAYEINIIRSEDLGARWSMDFTKEEVRIFLEKLGYNVVKIGGPSRCRVDGTYEDHARFEELYVEVLVALKPGQEAPKRLDDSETMWNISLQNVFLHEMRKKILSL